MDTALAESASSTRRSPSSTALETGPASLAELVEATGLARADRAPARRRARGAPPARPRRRRAGSCSARGSASWPPRPARTGCSPPPSPILAQLRDMTGESAQLYRPRRRRRGLRGRGRAHQRAARHRPGRRRAADDGRLGGPGAAGLGGSRTACTAGCAGAKFTAATLAEVRRRGWAASVGRARGRASRRCPRRCAARAARVIAAVSVSGPIERLTRSPGRLHAPAVVAAGDRISRLLRAEY